MVTPRQEYHLPEPDLSNMRLKAFPNPMREDGVFVAEDREIEPYEGITAVDGSLIFPAIPKGLVFGRQMPQVLADRVIACWNAFVGWKTEDIASAVMNPPEKKGKE